MMLNTLVGYTKVRSFVLKNFWVIFVRSKSPNLCKFSHTTRVSQPEVTLVENISLFYPTPANGSNQNEK